MACQIGTDLGLGPADLQWGVTAFALPSGGLLLLFGRIADLYGRRRLFLAGLTLFTAASVLATLAWDPAGFLAGRALQGLAAAMIVPSGMSLLTTTFREGPERDRALGVSGLLLSLGFTAGMLLGGVLTDSLGWRSTMALNVVMGLGVLLAAPGLVFGMMGLAAAAGGVLAPKLAGRLGAHRTLVLGLAVQALFTAVLLAVGTGGAGAWLVMVAGSVACFGHLFAIVAYSITATSGLADEEQGLATGLVTSTQQVGITVGIPVLSAVAAARSDALRAAGDGFATATLGGVRLGLGVDAAVVAAIALLVWFGLRRRA
ncbi:MFS transporter [Saccharothrix sp. ST-888]|uniref:MFS transporter n=1 Tax=Saccharothrix sp. ST-888 TaxID=1427391 RepID=UPI000696C078|nr:MFS transporter [Saccharothrix sp. ST-888]